MKVFSTFSGIGGFDLALQRKKFEIIGHSEIDKYADQIYSKHFNNPNYGDIQTIKAKDLPDFDMLVGGFPCQSFSIAGKRGGFNDTRGTLFFEVARIAREKQPRLLLLENVKGLLSHDEGKTFFTIISTLDELGYDCQWQVLNSKNFGVPQNRERVFIVGHLRGTSRPEVFPIKGGNEKFNGKTRQRNDIAHTITNSDKHRGSYVVPVLTPNRANKRQNGRRFKESGDPSFTLTAQDKHGIMLRDGRDNRSCLRAGRNTEVGFKGRSIRRLTPIECERLQGFPDNWTDGISDTQRYKCLGNAVTVNVIESILTYINHG